MAVAEQPALTFAGLLRHLRHEARLTQEELAAAAGLSPRSVSDLERGVHPTAHKDTAGLLADALNVPGPARDMFVAAATRALPRDAAGFTGRAAELTRLLGPAAGAAGRGAVSIHAIGGMAGIGKTALAVYATHQLAP